MGPMGHTLVNLLHEYHPTDAWEQECKNRMLAFIAQHADCFERTLAVGHFTASIWLLDQTGARALLMHHAKLDKWVQLGGHCDGDADILAVAIKEAQEESGLAHIVPVSEHIFDLDIHQVPARGEVQAHDHYDVRFLLQAVGNDAIVQNHESNELRWIGKDRAQLPTSSRSIVRMFDKWLAR